MTGADTLTYANVETLAVAGLGGNDSFTMTGISASTATTLDGGADTDSFTGAFASGFSGSLTLRLGSLEVRILQPGRGHTKGDTVVWLPAFVLLFDYPS